MRDGCAQGQALDALRSPSRTDLIAGNPPDFFCVGLEESLIQLNSETIDEEIFEGDLLLTRKEPGAEIAGTDPDHAPSPELV